MIKKKKKQEGKKLHGCLLKMNDLFLATVKVF